MDKTKIMFSVTDDFNETTTLSKTFDMEDEELTAAFLLNEFKLFLKSMSFANETVNRVVMLEDGDIVRNSSGSIVDRRV